MDVIKSSRFWISLAIVAAVTALACLKAISGGEAVASMLGLLGGFGVAKSGGGEVPK